MKTKLALISLFFPLFLMGQESSLSGQVTGSQGQAVPFAQIHFPALETGATANAEGKFLIESIPLGQHQVTFSSIGFVTTDTTLLFDEAREEISLPLQAISEELPAVDITDHSGEGLVQSRLKNIDGVAIYAAKKNEVIELKNISANLAANNARQVFARVPGIVVWENDCAGLQLGVGARGLSPDRTANFNTRQNGYDMAADALGYPESYYAPPMQAIDRIEIVRGAASLQYGTQFGGMINLKLKKGDPKRKLTGKTINTYNSVGYFNTYNEVGGQSGKLNYYSFVNYRTGNCHCENSEFDARTAHLRLGYEFSPRFEMVGEFTHMKYLAQQPGGLTDFQFEEDPYQSLRERNWFEVNWNLAALHLNYDLSDQTRINSRSFALLGSRKAVGFLSTPNRLDLTPHENRDLLVDYYKNFGNETRLLHRYNIKGKPAAFLIGARAYRGHTEKTQGFGSKGHDADFRFRTDEHNLISDYVFPSTNIAAFAENVFNITDRLSITPGLRYEYISTHADGYFDSSVRIPLTGEIVKDSVTSESRERERSILLAGIGVGYQLRSKLELYANISQNYRAITFNDMRVKRPSEMVDPDLQDEKGFNLDLGIRGSLVPGLRVDIGGFWLSYQERIGSVLTQVQDEFFGQREARLTTNVGDAHIYGLESYMEVNFFEIFERKSPVQLSSFLNLSLTEAYYHASTENAIENKRVENVPVVNLKWGAQARYKGFKSALQFTYLSEQFSEATNAETSSNGTYGIIPSYWVMDYSLNYKYKWLSLETGVNNITDEAYFTRRASGYPGPGIISSPPRNFYVGLGLEF